MSVLPLLTALALARACAPAVAPETLLSVVRTESGFDPLIIGVNGRPHRSLHPTTVAAAVDLAEALLARGENFDLGLAQINSRNLPRLGLTVRDALDPCRNLAGGAQVLTAHYLNAKRGAIEAQTALRAALSAYNTGDPVRGLRNGYVVKVQAAAAMIVPAIAATRSRPTVSDEEPPLTPPASASALLTRRGDALSETAPTSLDVFARGAPDSLVWPIAPRPPARRTRRAPPFTPAQGDPS